MPAERRLRIEWPRALIALLLAAGLWLVVSAEELTSSWITVNVSLALDPDVSLAEPVPVVEALVAGKRRELYKLFPSQLVLQRAVTDESGDSASLELRVQDVSLPTGSDVIVRDLRPRLLHVRLRHPAREQNDSPPAP